MDSIPQRRDIGSAGPSEADLAADARLPGPLADLIAGLQTGNRIRTPDVIFITGANGFLGRVVVRHLLDRPHTETIGLVRGKDDEHARRRMLKAISAVGVADDPGPRLRVLAGDITRPLLGLKPRRYRDLTDRTGHIFHLASVVHGSTPYDRLRSAAVDGTLQAVRFAVDCGGSTPLIHVSSTAAVPPKGRPWIHEANPLGEPAGLRQGYGQSKWVAERLVEAAADAGLPVVIARVGALAGDSRSGWSNPRDYRWLVLRAALRLGAAPLLFGDVRWTPADDAAAALIDLGVHPRQRRYHLTPRDSIPWPVLFSWVRRHGYRLRSVEPGPWTLAVADLSDNLSGLASLPITPEAPASTRSRVDPAATLHELETRGLRLRTPDETLIGQYLERARHDYCLPAPGPTPMKA